MLDVFDKHLKTIISENSFTEEFTVIPTGGGEPFVIKGIFDESVEIENGRRGTRPCPRIMLYEVPEYEAGKTEIIVRGKTYHAQKAEIDANNGKVLFLI